MATEILVNDGGAPCRIIPLVAASGGLSAGDALTVNSSGEAAKSSNNAFHLSGVALTDATAGEMCNVVTGRGVVVMINCTADNAAGQHLMTNEAVPGELIAHAGANDDTEVGIVLESPAAAGLTKVLLF